MFLPGPNRLVFAQQQYRFLYLFIEIMFYQYRKTLGKCVAM